MKVQYGGGKGRLANIIAGGKDEAQAMLNCDNALYTKPKPASPTTPQCVSAKLGCSKNREYKTNASRMWLT